MKIPSHILIVTGLLLSFAQSQEQPEKATGLESVLSKDAKVRKIAGDMKFTEGPVWLPKEEILVFSDIPNSILMQWSKNGGLKKFRKSKSSNGNLLDLDGRLLSCQHAGRNLIRWKSDGTAEELAGKFENKRFNSPNDVAVKSDGTLWFTDPPWGLKNRSEGREIEGNWVYRLNPDTGKVTVVTKSLDMPNGIAFSPDENVLYIADTGRIPKVRAFRVKADNQIDEKPLHYLDVRCDGMCVDTEGNVYTTASGGIHVFDKSGKKLGLIPVDEHPANCTFGGPDYKTLFITAQTSLYSVRLNNPGAKPPGAKW